MNRRPSAFTLIELLIVVAIISILASIAVPNFLEAQTRARVARAQSDLRTMAVAVEMYQVDNNTYPDRHKFPVGDEITGAGDLHYRMENLAQMTTPVAYISALPLDVFVPPNVQVGEDAPEEFTRDDLVIYDYWDKEIMDSLTPRRNTAWALVSIGPDGTMGTGGDWGHLPIPLEGYFSSYVCDYDASNGTISGGNIYRFPSTIPAVRVFLVGNGDDEDP